MNIPIELLITFGTIIISIGISYGMIRQKLKDICRDAESNKVAQMQLLESFKTNHLAHIQASLDRIEVNVNKLFTKVETCEVSISALNERTKK